VSERLVIGAFTPSVLLSVARESDRLSEQGLEAVEVPVASSPAQFRSLIDGELDVALTSPDNVLAYRFSPSNPLGAIADVHIVSTVDRGMGLALYGRPGLRSADDLRGAVLAVDVPTSGFALAMYALAESLGLARGDYELVALGSTPKRAAALVAGTCDATMLNAGNELGAEEAGCRRLASAAEVCSPYLGTVVAIEGDRMSGPGTRLASALRATAGDITSGRSEELARQQAQSVLGLSTALAKRYVDRLRSRDEGLILGAEIDLDGLTTIVDLRERYMPETVDGHSVYERALDPSSGLILPPVT
jgi:hypothetical protein